MVHQLQREYPEAGLVGQHSCFKAIPRFHPYTGSRSPHVVPSSALCTIDQACSLITAKGIQRELG